MKIRYFITIALVAILSYLIFVPAYFDHQVNKYKGDGTIENISWRFFSIPVKGYSITFDSFELSESFIKTYTLRNLPVSDGTKFYLAIEDPNMYYLDDSKKMKLEAKVEFSVTSQDGSVIKRFESKIKDMVWWTSINKKDVNTYGLYNSRKSNQTTGFQVDTGKIYKITINYIPDEMLKNHIGYLYIQWGGSI